MTPACLMCGGDTHFYAAVSVYQYVRCRQCGFSFTYPMPTADTLERFYTAAAFYDRALHERARLQSLAKGRLRTLAKLVHPGMARTLADIGCATGLFLGAARDAGWKAVGVEISPPLAKQAREAGHEVVECSAAEFAASSRRVDVVCAWEVLEHAMDPVALMKALAAVVETGGIVAISTPLIDGFPSLLMRSRFPMLCPPEHVSLFSARAMRELAKQCNLELLLYRSFSGVSWHNVMSYFQKMGWMRSAAGRIVVIPIACLAVTAFRLFDWMKRGSEIEVYLRKA